MRFVLIFPLIFLVCACSTEPKKQEGNQFSYSYSAFNFSGELWTRAINLCKSQGKSAKPDDTECGFFRCTSSFTCE